MWRVARRFWASAVAATFFGMAAMGCLLLRADRLDIIAVGAAAAAIGLAAGAEFVLPYFAGRYFGVERVGVVLGVLSMFFYVGSAIGPLEIGRLADITGSYDISLLIAASCFALGGGSLLMLGRYPPDKTISISKVLPPL